MLLLVFSQIEIVVRAFIFSFAGLLAGILVERIFLKKLEKFSLKTRTKFDDIFISSLRGIVIFLLTLVGFSVALNLYGEDLVNSYHLNAIVISLLIGSLTILASRIFSKLIKRRAADSSAKLPSTSIIVNITRIAIFLIGLMLVMQVFGISVTPMLTALGVGGLAVALALQETLSNLFSGIQLIASKNIRNGDFIQLSTGEKGYVYDITWRNTVIRELSNNLIVIPNSKVSSALITNYYLPEPELAVLVEVGVGYDNDLQKVEELTVLTAKKIQASTEGAIKGHEPFIRYHTFTESGINFSVILRGNEFTTQYLIKHEFIKALRKTYKTNDISFSIPLRQLYFKNTDARSDKAISGQN